MRNENDCLLQLNPVKKYVTPKYPVYTQASENPGLLKKLPTRWQKNAKVVSCLGLMGTITASTVFTGCPWLHHGGSGGAPIYVVYLTELEALSLIKAEAEKAGLNLNSTPPDFSVEIDYLDVGLDLYDEDKAVALSLVGKNEKTGWGWGSNWWYKSVAERASEEFAKQENDITVGVLYNPGEEFGWNEPSAAAKKEAEELLKEQLASQVKEFILWLQAEGIIQ